ncbi:hypothetical protein HW132_31095 [Brasilonema sp. CT11]|nr:hypothetical protein [Brasilonema sp. CT11]
MIIYLGKGACSWVSISKLSPMMLMLKLAICAAQSVVRKKVYQLSVISYQFEEEFSNSAILDSEGRNKQLRLLTSDF